MEDNKIAKLHLGEVLTCPMDFTVVGIRYLDNGKPMANLYNERWDLDISVYDEKDIDTLIGNKNSGINWEPKLDE